MKSTARLTLKPAGLLAVAAAGVLLSSCLPSHLDKYRKGGGGGGGSAAEPVAPTAEPGAAPAIGGGGAAAASAQPPQRATIYAVDRHTFRFQLRENDVWDTALNVLLRNYNLTIVDRQTGVVTTEWDSFYLGNAVYRNKVSLRVSQASRGNVDVTVHNSVERLRDASHAAGAVGAVWLPADDPANEVARIVQNMALLLGQPPPAMPPGGMVAKGKTPDGTSVSR